MSEQQVFTVGEVAKICKVAPRTVSKWFDSGKLRGYRLTGSMDRRIPRGFLIGFLEAIGGADLLGEYEDRGRIASRERESAYRKDGTLRAAPIDDTVRKRNDEAECARAYVESIAVPTIPIDPASDADAITAERLEAMGFDDGSFPLPSALRRPVTLYVECLCGELWRAKLDGVTGFVVLPTPLRTWGDVRKLLIGLGALP